jgi:hypothetical protein
MSVPPGKDRLMTAHVVAASGAERAVFDAMLAG